MSLPFLPFFILFFCTFFFPAFTFHVEIAEAISHRRGGCRVYRNAFFHRDSLSPFLPYFRSLCMNFQNPASSKLHLLVAVISRTHLVGIHEYLKIIPYTNPRSSLSFWWEGLKEMTKKDSFSLAADVMLTIKRVYAEEKLSYSIAPILCSWFCVNKTEKKFFNIFHDSTQSDKLLHLFIQAANNPADPRVTDICHRIMRISDTKEALNYLAASWDALKIQS